MGLTFTQIQGLAEYETPLLSGCLKQASVLLARVELSTGPCKFSHGVKQGKHGEKDRFWLLLSN